MKTLILSGINLFEGGPLSIYYDFLDTILKLNMDKDFKIICFVHKKSLFYKYDNRVELIELPDSRNSYLKRLWYEYVYFHRYSLKEEIDIWISLHDITPRVKAKEIYTYCHNPSPFMKKDLSKIKYSITNVAFSFFYKYLYRINIKAATAIIVQQDWMRNEFLELYPIKNVIVARPNIKIDYEFKTQKKVTEKTVFVFASFPRYFKNFEVICEACKLLKSDTYEVLLTLDGSENSYSKFLIKKYGDIRTIKWIGLQKREQLFEIYNQADCFIFPSVLETWGLPISEFKTTGKPMILADLPYAHETLGTYEKVLFFEPNDSHQLRRLMLKIIENKDNIEYEGQIEKDAANPYASNWNELLSIIIN
ncbi:glycosyltransferase Gtf1 [Lachnospiraceae bacterium]|nr:glycosyltransferase Gtf1 [Lachnospiraceae bacterium]